jgi:hypothetical protein
MFSKICSYHIVASRGKHHILGIELNTLHWAVVISIKNAYLIRK